MLPRTVSQFLLAPHFGHTAQRCPRGKVYLTGVTPTLFLQRFQFTPIQEGNLAPLTEVEKHHLQICILHNPVAVEIF